jgi:type IV pilus assembly protein PilW
MYLYQFVTYKREKGFSLVEFMVAITISMIILLAASIAWQSGYSTQKAQSDISQLNETVRFSIDLLSREIKQAGFLNKASLPPLVSFCSTAMPGVATITGSAIAGVNDPATINATATGSTFSGAGTTVANLSDAIRVRYYGDDTTVGNGTSPSFDCLGNTIPDRTLVEDTLYVAPDPNNLGANNTREPALWCYTSNPNSAAAPSQPMVSGVESLQILYGEELNNATWGYSGVNNHYVPAQLVTNWDHVRSVKISIIARSANAMSNASPTAKVYYHFGTAPATADAYTDPTTGTTGTTFTPAANVANRYRLIQPFSTEISVRNINAYCQ